MQSIVKDEFPMVCNLRSSGAPFLSLKGPNVIAAILIEQTLQQTVRR